jgi:DNA repair protein RecN (Recombination protein N)
MLTHLTLKDFAVVSAAELSFGAQMTVVSGETGAGKSLLVDALLWLTGARADAGIVRHGAERAELNAEFALDDAAEATAWLRDAEFDDDGMCQLRRVIRADGGSRAWINGRPATLSQLSELGALLVEIHGQQEHQALLERGHQLTLLDAFGQHADFLTTLRDLSSQWSMIDKQIAELSRTGDVGDRIAYLEHQLTELGRELLDPADIDELVSAHRRQSHATGLLQACDLALTRLSGDDGFSIYRSLRQTLSELSKLVEHEPRLADVVQGLESVEIQIDEANGSIERIRDDLDTDPQTLQDMENRLARLHDLARKHRVALHELGIRRDALTEEVSNLRGAGDKLQALYAELEKLAARWREVANRLSKSRASAAKTLGDSVTVLMGELGMAGGVFSVALEPSETGKPNALGAERSEFLVTANPGQPPRPLRKVASGGELARISLAIEVAALGLDAVPTMIFDEVDSGIGGAVAEVVGRKLRALGEQRQVMCVTHLPQVAAQGHHHFQVSKAVNGGSTHSAVTMLDDKARIEELARMLGGVEITKETRANAKQMLTKAKTPL